MFKNILAAVDGTAHGTAVLDAAAALAKQTAGTVHVIHIRPSQVVSVPAGLPAVRGARRRRRDSGHGRHPLPRLHRRHRGHQLRALPEVCLC